MKWREPAGNCRSRVQARSRLLALSQTSDLAPAEATIDVVVLNWNGGQMLVRCLETLGAQTIRHNVIVVDNGSTDSSLELVGERFPGVRQLPLLENRGFTVGNNRGVAEGSAQYVVLANNDIECDPAFLERLTAPFSDEGVGMVAALLLRPGRQVIDSYGLELDRTLAAFPRFGGRSYDPDRLHEDGLAMPTGAAAAYRRDAFEGVGGFDEALFAYMEDVDLGLRLRAEGWRCGGAPDALAVHLGSASFGRRSRGQVEFGGVARGYMLRKYGVLGHDLVTAAMAVAAETAAVAAEVVLGRDLAALRGRVAGWNRAAGVRAEAPPDAINDSIGLLGSLRRRRAGL